MIKFATIWFISFVLCVYMVEDDIPNIDARFEYGIGMASVMSIFVTVIWELIADYFKKKK
jgi:hypothetical protein